MLTCASLIRANYVPLVPIRASTALLAATLVRRGLTARQRGPYSSAPHALLAPTQTTERLHAHLVLPDRGEDITIQRRAVRLVMQEASQPSSGQQT